MDIFVAFGAGVLATISLEGIAIFIWLLSSMGTTGKEDENETQKNT